MPNYNEQEMRMLANLLGKPALPQVPTVDVFDPSMAATMYRQTGQLPPMGIGKTGEMNRKAVYDAVQLQSRNRLPIPVNENNMPMFNTDEAYMKYLNEYDPAMFNEMQNTYYNTRGNMGEGKIEPMKYFKGLFDYFGGN
jgi:hypothetical protein